MNLICYLYIVRTWCIDKESQQIQSCNENVNTKICSISCRW